MTSKKAPTTKKVIKKATNTSKKKAVVKKKAVKKKTTPKNLTLLKKKPLAKTATKKTTSEPKKKITKKEKSPVKNQAVTMKKKLTKDSSSQKKAASKTVMTKVKPTDIFISGDMYECMYLTITESQFNELASIGKDENEEGLVLDDSEAWCELEDEIMGDSVINGFTFNDSYANFIVTVGSEEQPALIGNFIRSNAPLFSNASVKSPITQPKSFYLILEKWSKRGVKSVTIQSAFDRDSLSLSVDDCVLPTGEQRLVADLCYGYDDFEFSWSQTSNEELYVYCSDGVRIDLKY